MYILYVGRDKDDVDEFCPGSLVCLCLVEKLSSVEIQVQDCSILRQTSELPGWLDGTPMLINERERVPLRGKDAINILRNMLKLQKREEEEKPVQQAVASRSSTITSAEPRMHSEFTRTKEDSTFIPIQEDPMINASIGQQEEIREEDDPSNLSFEMPAQVDDTSYSTAKLTEQDLQKYLEKRNKR